MEQTRPVPYMHSGDTGTKFRQQGNPQDKERRTIQLDACHGFPPGLEVALSAPQGSIYLKRLVAHFRVHCRLLGHHTAVKDSRGG